VNQGAYPKCAPARAASGFRLRLFRDAKCVPVSTANLTHLRRNVRADVFLGVAISPDTEPRINARCTRVPRHTCAGDNGSPISPAGRVLGS